MARRLTLTILALLATLGSAFAAPPVDLASIANGQHEFKRLGAGFYAEVPVRRIPEGSIHLALANYALARRFGIALPSDPAELERIALDQFGWEVDPTGRSPKKWFATHYLDSDRKGPGEAMGDGRALWTGELVLRDADGKPRHVDVLLKGVGVTPFAWLNNESHRDGNQSIEEMVNSAFLSRANALNGLDSTEDLLGFVVIRDGKAYSMTLRLGDQVRLAHLRFHADDRRAFRRLADYVVRRDLGLPSDAPVGWLRKTEWVDQLVRNLATEAARYFDLDMIQESPTTGNRTTRGGTIDLAGIRYFEDYPADYRHLFARLKVGDQKDYIRGYVETTLKYLRRGGYFGYFAPQLLRKQWSKQFDRVWQAEFETLTLRRLGLDDAEIARVPANLRAGLARSVEELKLALGKGYVNFDGSNPKIHPAAFDMRRTLSESMDYFATHEGYKITHGWESVFDAGRAGRGAENLEVHQWRMRNYLDHVAGIGRSLSPAKPRAEWLERAAAAARDGRTGPPKQGDFWKGYTGETVASIERGDTDFRARSAEIEHAARKLVPAAKLGECSARLGRLAR